MRHCSTCAHCNENIVAVYVKGVPRYNCTVNHTAVNRPFWGGFHCKNYIKDKGFFSERGIL